MLRVLHSYKVYFPDSFGGIPEVIAAAATSVEGQEHRIITARPRGCGRTLTIDGVPVMAASSLISLFSMPLAPTFPFLLRRAMADCDVLVHHAPFPLNDITIALGAQKRVAVVVHWHAEIVGRKPFVSLLAPFFHRTLERAESIVVSDPVLVENSSFLQRYADKSVVVPFGVDFEYWSTINTASDAEAVGELRQRYPRLILAVGRLVGYKGFDVLVRAVRAINATAVIVGTGTEAAALQRLAAELGVADRLFLVGHQTRDQLRRWFHAAQVFAFPSVSSAETFGISQLEAMAAGLPIVNTSLPTAVPLVARHQHEALTVPPHNSVALARALEQLLDNHVLARRLGNAAQERAKANYQRATFVKRVNEIYMNAAERHGKT